jgi:NAD(P)-dependent dehydrogenase (short-subunit alcohol dehydrogenase family)
MTAHLDKQRSATGNVQDLMTVTGSRSPGWTAADVGDQRGRIVVVTGANTGIGLETAAALAEHGARIVLACRDASKAEAAATRITEAVPGAVVEMVGLDLASLASIRQAAAQIRSRHEQLDVLINNAGLCWPPFGRTQDGFELQIGTNHLGHFALTGLLLDRLTGTPGSRIITVSSVAHHQGHIESRENLNLVSSKPFAGGSAPPPQAVRTAAPRPASSHPEPVHPATSAARGDFDRDARAGPGVRYRRSSVRRACIGSYCAARSRRGRADFVAKVLFCC